METHPRGAELTVRNTWRLDGWVTTVRLREEQVAAAAAPGRLALGTWGSTGPDLVIGFDSAITDLAAHPDGWLLSLEAGSLVLVSGRGEVLERRDGVGGWRLAGDAGGFVAVDRNGSVALVDQQLKPLWTESGPSAWDICLGYGLVATPSTEGSVSCRAAATGELLWRYTEPYPVYGCTAVDGGYAVGTAEGSLAVLDLSGTVVQRRATHAVRMTVRAGGSELLAACVDGTLRSYDSALTELWRFTTGSWVKGVDVRADTVAVASADHHLYLLDRDGRELGRHQAGHTVLCVARDDSRLTAGSADGLLYFLTCDQRSTIHV
ncbi:PQQ-binding-like beta-propeller repeat protein [Streptomyces sp. NPDC048257]|uniref:outer membrane protein assembly factor BamB family protein n=1 Tax=Streptomyces sp. NPDC048257 TaxID=3365526 RepID=UPI00371D85A5